MPAAAIVATAAIGAYTANKASKAQKSAANTQAASADRASQVQWDMFNQQRADMEPWRQAGMQGLSQYQSLLGMGQPDGSDQYARAAYLKANPDVARNGGDPWNHFITYGKNEGRTWGGGDALQMRLAATPGYQAAFKEGQRALDSSAAASGGLFSGKAGKELMKYGQNYADQQYGNALNRYANLAGIGQTATTQIGQFGQNAANQVGQNLMNAGAARASGIQGSANAWSDYAGGLTGLAGMYLGRNGGNWGWGGV